MDQYVIWTRYVRPTGAIVRHAYGPYDSRYLANKEVQEMKARHVMSNGANDLVNLEVHTMKLLHPEGP